jgi:hypothetical protein
MTELLSLDELPSFGLWLAGVGVVVLALLAVLVQRAARDWMFWERTEELKRHNARVEAGWRQAM